MFGLFAALLASCRDNLRFQSRGTINSEHFRQILTFYLIGAYNILSRRADFGTGFAFFYFKTRYPMRINLIPTKKLAILSAAFCAAMLALSPNAKALTFGDPNDLGQVLFGIPSGDAARLSYVNHLIGMALNSSDSFNGQTFFRSGNDPANGNYPAAQLAGNVNGTGTTIDLGAQGTFLYLFAKYDGPNAGSEVWYVGNLSGIITIPAVGLAGQNYGLSGWTLFRGEGAGVPDGGATVMLLGAALGALGMARRFLKS
jgi:hypothetical protein